MTQPCRRKRVKRAWKNQRHHQSHCQDFHKKAKLYNQNIYTEDVTQTSAGSMIIILVSVRLYEYCFLKSQTLLPVFAGFPEVFLIFVCEFLHQLPLVASLMMMGIDMHQSMCISGYHQESFNFIIFFLCQLCQNISQDSGLSSFWFLGIQAVWGMSSFSWCGLQFTSVIGWPLAQALCCTFYRQNKLQV